MCFPHVSIGCPCIGHLVAQVFVDFERQCIEVMIINYSKWLSGRGGC